MALALESAGKVSQKSRKYNLNPLVFYSLKAFFLYWATNKGNEDLQLIPFSDSTTATDGISQATGYSPIGVASRLYVLYAKNNGAGDGTDAFIGVHNATDNASAPLVTAVIQDDNDQFILVNPNGWVFGTDLTISAATTNGGATESAANNSADGFVIIGAA